MARAKVQFALCAERGDTNAVIDITSERPPRVTASTCDHSAALEETGQPGIYAPTGPPWGVCSGD